MHIKHKTHCILYLGMLRLDAFASSSSPRVVSFGITPHHSSKSQQQSAERNVAHDATCHLAKATQLGLLMNMPHVEHAKCMLQN